MHGNHTQHGLSKYGCRINENITAPKHLFEKFS